MRATCLGLLALNIAVVAAALAPHSTWSYEVCWHAYGLCDYPMPLSFGIAALVGAFCMMQEAREN